MAERKGVFEKPLGQLPAFLKQALLVLSGSSIAQIIPGLLSPILTRQYHPNDFGLFALVYALLGIFGTISCLRYEMAVVLPAEERDSVRLISISAGICLVMALTFELACIAILWLLPSTKVGALALPMMAMVPIGVIFMGWQQIAQSWCVRTHNFHAMSVAMIAQALTTITTQILLAALWGSSPYFLIAGVQLGLVVSVSIYAWFVGRNLVKLVARHASWSEMRKLARSYIRFPLFTMPYVFVAQAATRGNLLLLASMTAVGVVGQFALAQRVIYFPVSTIMASASQIFFSRAPSRLDDPRLLRAMERALLAAPLIAGPPFLAVCLFAEPLFVFFFGTNWAEAGRFASFLTIPSLLVTSIAWMDRLYDILGRQRLALILEVANDVAALSSVYLVLRLTHNPIYAVAAYAISTSIYCVVWTFFTVQIAKLSLSIPIKSLILGAIMTALVCLVNWAGRTATDAIVFQLLWQIVFSLPIMAAGIAVAIYGLNARAILNGLRARLPRVNPDIV